MKKFLAFMILFLLAFSMISCEKNSDLEKEPEAPSEEADVNEGNEEELEVSFLPYRVFDMETFLHDVEKDPEIRAMFLNDLDRNGKVSDLLLEDGDEIVIPQKSDVVQVSGEVAMPKAVTFEKGMTIEDYLKSAGGLTDRGDEDNILIARMNGEVGPVSEFGVRPGDRVLVMPRVDSKNLELAKGIMQVLYQIAVATKVVVDL